jgi:hypothetical protein
MYMDPLGSGVTWGPAEPKTACVNPSSLAFGAPSSMLQAARCQVLSTGTPSMSQVTAGDFF